MLKQPVPFVVAATIAVLALTGCSGSPAPSPTETDAAAGASGAGPGSEPGTGGAAAPGDGGALASAEADGMPALPLVPCPGEYEYSVDPSGSRTLWRFDYTCVDSSAFDASTAALVAEGYDLYQEGVYGDATNVSNYNLFQADANGGSTEVSLKVVGSPGDLDYSIVVTLTLP